MKGTALERAVLLRKRPDRMPLVFPLPEYLADGDRKEDYEDTKAVFQVPWMGVVAMAFSHYRKFYRTLWRGLRPVFQSAEFVASCNALCRRAEELATELSPPPLTEALTAKGYAPPELQNIKNMIAIFHHGNFPYVLLATMARILLEGKELSARRAAKASSKSHAPEVSVPFVLMEAHHADAPTREIYEEIKSALHLPIVNTDYRALARWPSYFALAWNSLRPSVATLAYESVVQVMHDEIVSAALTLPNPGALTSEALRAAALDDGAVDDIQRTVELFQWLLPGLIVNVAYFRAQLM